MIPRARTQGVTTSTVNGETVVYDLDRHHVHRLNQTAALVWKRCDGKSSVAEIAAEVGRELSAPASEELVHQALDQLQQAHLLEDIERLSRRELGQRARLTGALLVLAPVVTSIVAPAAAHAKSGRGGNQVKVKIDKGGYKGDGGGGGKKVGLEVKGGKDKEVKVEAQAKIGVEVKGGGNDKDKGGTNKGGGGKGK